MKSFVSIQYLERVRVPVMRVLPSVAAGRVPSAGTLGALCHSAQARIEKFYARWGHPANTRKTLCRLADVAPSARF
ncbi:hypothetical protein GCM10010315_12880 [Streptomyces luteosporeus]|uniref:Uncharacterized protein n=1 Tax=Streptomyces luteosporeus TaxID=173856 RepID=A0ABP6G1E1_9ACTN